MSKKIIIGISDLNIAAAPDVLISYALGSCVGICLFDRTARIGGLAHIMLPSSLAFRNQSNIMKFADTAGVELVKQMEKIGARRIRMVAKIAGGAQMFANQGISDTAQIGRRNVDATKEVLEALRIPIIAEDTGLDYGRTIEFFPETGLLRVKSITKGIKEI